MRRMVWGAMVLVACGLVGCGGDPLKPGTRVVVRSAKAGEKYVNNYDSKPTFLIAWNGSEAVVLRRAEPPERLECKVTTGVEAGHIGIFHAKDLVPLK